MTDKVTQHRASVFLTSDLAVEFTVFDHHDSDVPESVWEEFTASYEHAHGSPPASTLTGYVTRAIWRWSTTYTDGTVVIGDDDGPLVLETGLAGPEGCRIVFWDEGTDHDTGLRVWATEADLIARMLAEKKAAEDSAFSD